MSALLALIVANKAAILGVLFGLSEGLAYIPSVKANSVFQLIFGWLSANKPQA